MTLLKEKQPLEDYPWACEVDRLLASWISKDKKYRAFLFDLVMSLAYIDATTGIEKSVQYCKLGTLPFNGHIGFINLCAKCYTAGIWQYQKAAKPQSGALGKLSSEVILRFIQHLSDSFTKVVVLGGTNYADAMLEHVSGVRIFAEVKCAPLITFPLLINLNQEYEENHSAVTLTNSQLNECESALYVHEGLYIPLGKVGSQNWPFKGLVDFVANDDNEDSLNKYFEFWLRAKKSYINKDKTDASFYLTNACGLPPSAARQQWNSKEVISDGKTSAGMDRTDDIKKAIYQTLKIGATHYNDKNVKSAIISNLPALRHGKEYIDPLSNIIWSFDSALTTMQGVDVVVKDDFRQLFDYIITLDESVLRELEL